MAYEQVTQSETIGSSTGSLRLTVTATKALVAGTRQVVRRTCARFAGDSARTPVLLEPVSVDGLIAKFVSTGTSLFGPTLSDFDQPTSVVFTPLIVDLSDAVVFEGTPFTVTLTRVTDTFSTDLPVTDSIYRLWDTGSYLELDSRTWYDKRYGDQIRFNADSSGGLLASLAIPTTTQFKLNGLRFQSQDLVSTLTAAGLMDVPLPPQWTLCILGYTQLSYGSITDLTRVYDAALGYETTTPTGPYEGAYLYQTDGAVFSSQKIPVTPSNRNMANNKCTIITSDTTLPQVQAYADNTLMGSAAVDTTSYGKLKTLFPRLDSMSFGFVLGQIVIYDRILSPAEVTSYYDYASSVWYDTPV